jgi:hypothetical protein
MPAYTNYGETIWTKRNSGRKSALTEWDRASYTERNCFDKWHKIRNYRIFLNLEDPVSTKTTLRELHKNPTFTVMLRLVFLWLLKIMLRCVTDSVTAMKPGHQTTGNVWWVTILDALPWILTESFVVFLSPYTEMSVQWPVQVLTTCCTSVPVHQPCCFLFWIPFFICTL